MTIAPIKNENGYHRALARLEKIFDAEKGTKDGDELEVLAILIDTYEDKDFLLD
ncbi:MAG: hypothetical protein KA186_10750 [Flavobacteriales bacterium]|nr:hypothetical protein [Flavobacteriales bacterium]